MSAQSPYWIALGDIHGNTAPLASIPELPGAAGVIVTGDMTIRGGVPEASAVLEAVAAINPRVLAQIGNMDKPPVQDWLDGRGQGIHARAVELAPGAGLMGVGWSPRTPFGTPSEASEEQIAQWLVQAYEQARDFTHLALISHAPPFGTSSDVLGNGAHVGSPAVREFIERVQPEVCVTGHIHEARGVDALGRTVIVNPGELAAGGYVLLRLEADGFAAELKTIGHGGRS